LAGRCGDEEEDDEARPVVDEMSKTRMTYGAEASGRGEVRPHGGDEAWTAG
jgi:hypothetical protein